jgi:hypothetical protein
VYAAILPSRRPPEDVVSNRNTFIKLEELVEAGDFSALTQAGVETQFPESHPQRLLAHYFLVEMMYVCRAFRVVYGCLM